MWKYYQSTGQLYHNDKFVSKGYSGNARGKNNPALQNLKGIGPIPCGEWALTSVYNSKNVGPFTITLHSIDNTPNNDVHDITQRSGFRIHGDSIKNPGTASKGCIILPRKIREQIWYSKDRYLKVLP